MKCKTIQMREEEATEKRPWLKPPHPKVVASCLLLFLFCLVPLASPAHAGQNTQAAKKNNAVYVCPMDSEVKSTRRGKCPKCGMALRKASSEIDRPVAESANAEANRNGDVAKPRQIPDTTVFDQDGRKLRFYSDLVKGKIVAINFIFTTCTTVCPPLTATFRKLQQELAERVDREVQLISISVDPATDVPERLKTFSARFHAGPGWTFVTGDHHDIRSLLKALGAGVGDKNNHSPMVLVGNDSAGYWTRTYGVATVGTLVTIIEDAITRTTSQVPTPIAESDGSIGR